MLAVACVLVQSQPCYQKAYLNGDDTFWEHRLLAKGTLKSEPVKYDSLHAQHSKIMANIVRSSVHIPDAQTAHIKAG